ncbi:50S ribosomal protein L14e [archaeon]|nr:MAG: 50S ribosomal protein L14e [archaeon]RLG66055.1 MAG: 50S ribosomal protein L14e [archaeon]RLG66129.1 MAG: 50S ribosomal protein L14e [archaeon]HDM23607.1 50S ribosomal protein L14e [Candidatus Bathyarchaeota archaeon]
MDPTLLAPGRICIKLKGREKLRYAVIVKKLDKNYVVITGPKEVTGVRRRKVNIKHIKITPMKIDIPEDASDEEIIKKLKELNLLDKLKEKVKLKKEVE